MTAISIVTTKTIRMMDSMYEKTLYDIKQAVKERLDGAEAGHDWWHIQRVYNTAQHICLHEDVDTYIVLLGALLHDIADAKFYRGDETVGPKVAYEIMRDHNVVVAIAEHVINIIKHMSFKNSLEISSWSSPEMLVVQDADRLDAIGAIGIARAFSYGGHKGRIFYDPSIFPMTTMTKEEYKNSAAPTINHFYEKLLLLKDSMNTNTGKQLAEERHQFMLDYLRQFYAEWYGTSEIPAAFQLS